MNNKIMSSSSPTRLSCMFFFILLLPFTLFLFFPLPLFSLQSSCSLFFLLFLFFFFDLLLLLFLLLLLLALLYLHIFPSFLPAYHNQQTTLPDLLRTLTTTHPWYIHIPHNIHTFYLYVLPDIQYIITTRTSTPHKDWLLFVFSSPGFFPIYGFLIIDNLSLDDWFCHGLGPPWISLSILLALSLSLPLI